ncbi:putative MATE family efflux protein [Sedimentibacter acidaminivorans]|uniref:Multidrug export protein MepA n=1 Tax=Sedimentibacter acidaminivorans TaxID=913099 RepID=A0ABS4GHZ2_9FIRM|nr:MATE family efflux transporter [Sedimentibacter acidaminivorans]MBP1927321.1 putative MATE family efflux protein [Sedimentibacter acidaminivorans]
MKKKFFNYVIPSVLAMWIYSIYTMVDGIFVAKGVGESALASINISMPVVNSIFSLAILFAVGSSTIASIHLGNKEKNEASQVFTNNMVTLITISITITTVILFNLEQISYFLGATQKTIFYVKEYLGIISLFSVFYMLSYYFEVLVKTDGYPRLATIVVCISAVTNIFLDYVFVIKLGYGVKGAAFATGISHVVACIVYLWHFIKVDSKIKFTKYKFDLNIIKRTIPLGASDFITEFSLGFTVFMFNRIILKNIGDAGIVTYTIIMYVNMIVLMTMGGISQGMQPLVSYYYGRDDKKSYTFFIKSAVKVAVFISLGVYVITMIFAKQINGIFIIASEIELLNYSVKAFRIYVTAYLIVGLNIVIIGFYTAIEKPLYSMILSIGRGFVIITLSLLLMTSLLGENGIWISSFVSEAICLLIGSVIFIRFFFNDLFIEKNAKNAAIEHNK